MLIVQEKDAPGASTRVPVSRFSWSRLNASVIWVTGSSAKDGLASPSPSLAGTNTTRKSQAGLAATCATSFRAGQRTVAGDRQPAKQLSSTVVPTGRGG